MQVFIEHEDYQKIAKAIAFIRQNHLSQPDLTTVACHNWAGLQTLVVEQSNRTLWNKTTQSLRFFLSSLNPEYPDFPRSIRSH
jgi:hypothetical protein